MEACEKTLTKENPDRDFWIFLFCSFLDLFIQQKINKGVFGVVHNNSKTFSLDDLLLKIIFI